MHAMRREERACISISGFSSYSFFASPSSSSVQNKSSLFPRLLIPCVSSLSISLLFSPVSALLLIHVSPAFTLSSASSAKDSLSPFFPSITSDIHLMKNSSIQGEKRTADVHRRVQQQTPAHVSSKSRVWGRGVPVSRSTGRRNRDSDPQSLIMWEEKMEKKKDAAQMLMSGILVFRCSYPNSDQRKRLVFLEDDDDGRHQLQQQALGGSFLLSRHVFAAVLVSGTITHTQEKGIRQMTVNPLSDGLSCAHMCSSYFLFAAFVYHHSLTAWNSDTRFHPLLPSLLSLT